MPSIVTLGPNDIDVASDLLATSFEDDVGFGHVFQTASSKRRWLRRVMAAASALAIDYGIATGIRNTEGDGLAAVAYWFLPERPFPPPWYRTLIPSLRLTPLVLEIGTYLRYWQLYQTYLSMLPRNERYLYLSSLAVWPDVRKKGMGGELIQSGLANAAQRKCAVFLQCWSSLLPYYGRFGFVKISERRLAGTNNICHGLLWRPQAES